MKKKKLYILVGAPATGKSTWVRENVPDAFCVSFDNCIDRIREPLGLKYNDMFTTENMKKFRRETNSMLIGSYRDAVASGRDVVVDMTNMTVRSRMRALDNIRRHGGEFEKIAVVFDHRGKGYWVCKRAKDRSDALGDKFIPFGVIIGMMNRFDMPTLEEGFDSIVMVNIGDFPPAS
jgi:predicted kinase